MNVNVDFMEENVIQVNGEIMINVNVNVKNAMYVKKIMFAILLHVIVKTEKKLASITDDSAQQLHVMKLKNRMMKTQQFSRTTKQTLFQQILMKKKQPVKHKIFIFYFSFFILI